MLHMVIVPRENTYWKIRPRIGQKLHLAVVEPEEEGQGYRPS